MTHEKLPDEDPAPVVAIKRWASQTLLFVLNFRMLDRGLDPVANVAALRRDVDALGGKLWSEARSAIGPGLPVQRVVEEFARRVLTEVAERWREE